MNRELFYTYLHDASTMDSSSSKELQSIVEQYPYFQTARLLYLKALHENKSVAYQSELKITATYAGNRSVLFQLIKKKSLGKNIAVKPQETIVPKTEEKHLFQEIVEVNRGVGLVVDVAESKPNIFASESFDLFTDTLLNFDFTIAEHVEEVGEGSYRFKAEELNIEQADEPKKKMQSQLISKFIETNPKLGVNKNTPVPSGDLSLDSVKDNEFMTETLAEIYVKQHKIEKAITMYEKLSLKYPQKSFTFATRIDELKDISKNEQKN